MIKQQQAKINLKIVNQRNPKLRDGMIFLYFTCVEMDDDYGQEPHRTLIKFLQKLIKLYDIQYFQQIRFDHQGHLVDFDILFKELYCLFPNKFQKQWFVFHPYENQYKLMYYHQLPWAIQDYEQLITNKRIRQYVDLESINRAFDTLESLFPDTKITNPLHLDLEDSIQGALIELNYWMQFFCKYQEWPKIYIDQNGDVQNLLFTINLLKDHQKDAGLNTPTKKKSTNVLNAPVKKYSKSHNPNVSQFCLDDCKDKQQEFRRNIQFEGMLYKVDIQVPQNQNVLFIQNPTSNQLNMTQVQNWNTKTQMQKQEMFIGEQKNYGFYKPTGQEEKSFKLWNTNQDENRINQQQKSSIFLNQSTFERSQFKQ